MGKKEYDEIAVFNYEDTISFLSQLEESFHNEIHFAREALEILIQPVSSLDFEIEEAKSWGKVSKIRVDSSVSYDSFPNEHYHYEMIYETSSSHLVVVKGAIEGGQHPRFPENREVDEFAIKIGKDDSEYFYPQVRSIAKKISEEVKDEI